MNIGLFFGSFNPIHTGHLIIANYFAEFTNLRQVWFVISPQNPFKEKTTLLDEKHRLYMVNLAIEDNFKLKASSIEFHLPQPSYTVNTLAYITEKYPQHQFSLLMGSDNLQNLHKWKNYTFILNNYPIYVYKRQNFNEIPLNITGNIQTFNVPLLDISSTFIRQCIKDGKSIRYFVPDKVFTYIEEMHFYRS